MRTPEISWFSKLLLTWDMIENKRSMPWKGIKDPYKIWLSEIILQQTRVDQGEKYYLDFIRAYPSVFDLAAAPESEVFKRWQGLGYYNRCRNLLKTAHILTDKYSGEFPVSYDEILALKGIGEYTAAAIASFAFNMNYAVIDGNVVRVLSRVFALNADFSTTKGKQTIRSFAQSLLPQGKAALYNQAIMDLGATICTPQQPACKQCPFRKKCLAFLHDDINNFPVRKIKAPLRPRTFHFFVFENGPWLFLHQRTGNDIWQSLYTFYMIEGIRFMSKQIPSAVSKSNLITNCVLSQTLSHQKLTGYFYKVLVDKAFDYKLLGLTKVHRSHLSRYAFPKMIVSFFENNHYL